MRTTTCTAVTNISVTPASQDLEGGLSTTLTCLAEGTPLPAITWQRNGQFVTAGAVQAATGFRETARSTLTLVTSTTQLTEMIICTANTQTEGPTVTDTATAVVNIASRLIHQRPALVTLYSLPPPSVSSSLPSSFSYASFYTDTSRCCSGSFGYCWLYLQCPVHTCPHNSLGGLQWDRSCG